MNDREPMPKRGRPRCPEWLDEEARKLWKRLVPELDRLGLLTVVDVETLSSYCQAWAEFKDATQTLKKEGRVIKQAIGLSGSEEDGFTCEYKLLPHPAVAMQRSAWKALKDFASLFGLDPSSRVRLKTPDVRDEPDELEGFLGEMA